MSPLIVFAADEAVQNSQSQSQSPDSPIALAVTIAAAVVISIVLDYLNKRRKKRLGIPLKRGDPDEQEKEHKE